MNTKFFEKVGKLTFSILLTGTLVTTAVFALNIVRTDFADGEILSAVDLNAIQPAIDSKVSKTDFPTCAVGESLTYDGVSFNCTSPVAAASIESIQAGMVTNTSNSNKTVNVTFATPFTSTPQVVVSAAGFYLSNSSRGETFNLNLSYSNVTTTGFKITLPGGTPNNHQMRIRSASWIAIPASGSWNSPTTSNVSSTCAPGPRTTNNEKSGSCIKGTYNNIYYGGETTCTGPFGPPDGEGMPSFSSGYKYSTKYTQTCN